MTRVRVMVLIAALIAAASFAHASDAGFLLSVSCPGCRPRHSTPSSALAGVFPADAARLDAVATFTGGVKRKAGFSWYSPDGKLLSHTDKLAFPSGGSDTVIVRDRLDKPGQPGIWKLEVVSGDMKASVTFLLTGNPRLLSIANGTLAEKASALYALDASKPDARELVEVAFTDADADVRRAAVMAASRTSASWASGVMAAGLADVAPAVRAASVSAMVGVGGDAGHGVASGALSDTSAEVRASLAEALGGVQDGWAADVLGRLVTDTDSGVRNAALTSLAVKKGPDAVAALSMGLAVDEPVFRRSVVGVLLTHDVGETARVLAGLLSDSDIEMRRRALSVLAGYNGDWPRREAVPLLDDPDENDARTAFAILSDAGESEAVMTALGSRHLSVRRAALSYIRAKGGGLAPDALTRALADPDPQLASIAIDGLIELGPAGLAGLKTAATAKDPDDRLKAVDALTRFKPEDAEAVMRASLGDTSPKVRLAALRYLISNQVEGIVAVLDAATSDPDEKIRALAFNTLCNTRGADAVRVLAGYYRKAGPDKRDLVAGCLYGRDDAVSTEIFTALLADSDQAMRGLAVGALTASGNLKPIYSLATDPDHDVKKTVLEAMKHSPVPDMIPVLKEALADPNQGVRLLAVDALGGIQGEGSSLLISGMVNDPSGDVRSAARRLVFSRADEGTAPGLVGLLGDAGKDTREQAADALVGLGGKNVDGYILAAYATGSAQVKTGVLDVISRRSPSRLMGVLMNGLGDGDTNVRQAAIKTAASVPEGQRAQVYSAMASYEYPDVRLASVGGLEGTAGTVVLVRLASDKDAAVRRAAVARLACLDAPEMSGMAAVLVTDPDREVASAALGYAISHKDEEAGTLVNAALGPHDDIAARAVDALIEMDDPRAVPAYEKMFRLGYKKLEMAGAMGRVPGTEPVGPLGMVYRESGRDEPLRLAAVIALGGRGDAALPVLTDALKDGSLDVRTQAVKSIGSMDDSPGKMDALAAALADTNPEVSRLALGELDRSGSAIAVSKMMSALNYVWISDDAYEAITDRLTPDVAAGVSPDAVEIIIDPVKRAAVLRQLSDKGFGVPGLSILLHDPSSGVRLEVVRGFAAAGGVEAAYGTLILCGDQAGDVSAAAMAAVSAWDTSELVQAVDLLFRRDSASTDILGPLVDAVHDQGLLQTVVAHIQSYDTARMRAVLEPMAERHEPYDIPAMLDGLKVYDLTVKKVVLGRLARVEPPLGGDALAEAYSRYEGLRVEIVNVSASSRYAGRILPEAMAAADPDIRALAVKNIGVVGGETGRGLAMNALESTYEDVRVEAVRVAGENGYWDVAGLAVSDPSQAVRVACAEAMRGRDGVEPGNILASIAAPGNPMKARLAALSILAERKDPSSSDVLAEALRDNDRGISDAGAAGLVAIGKDCLPVVHGMLSDEVAAVKALDVIAKIADPSSEPAVVELLGKARGGVLTAAIRAIGAVGGVDGIAALAVVFPGLGTLDRTAAVKSVATMRLGGGEPELVLLLGAALEDKDDGVRFYAARAAGILHVTALKARIAGAVKTDTSPIVRDEMARALELMEK